VFPAFLRRGAALSSPSASRGFPPFCLRQTPLSVIKKESLARRAPIKSRLSFLTLAVTLFVIGHSVLCAQEAKHRVTIMVTVMDPSGAVMPGAQLKISPPPDPPLKNPKTNNEGKFLVCLVPGGYDLYVSHPQFKPWSERLEISDMASHSVEVYLQLAETTQFIDMGGPSFPVQPATPHTETAGPSSPVQPLNPTYKDFPSATITVAVTDRTGASVPYAQIGGVPLLETERKLETARILETDEHGKISLKVIPLSFDLDVTSPGFDRWKNRIKIQNGESQTVDVILEALPQPKP